MLVLVSVEALCLWGFLLSHVAAKPALAHSAPQAGREISHTTVAAVLAAGEILPKQYGV